MPPSPRKKKVEGDPVPQVVLCADPTALVWWLSDVERATPGALLRPCLLAVKEPDEEHPWRVAASFPGQDLPGLDPRIQDAVSVVAGTVDPESRTVTLLPAGRRRKPTVVQARAAWSHQTGLEAAPLARRRDPDQRAALVLARGHAMAEVVQAVAQRPEQGQVAQVASGTDDGPAWLLDVGVPPWFVVDQLRREGQATAFRRIGKKRVLVEWGWKHPFEELLPALEPARPDHYLVLAHDGPRTMALGPWTPVQSGRWTPVPDQAQRSSWTGQPAVRASLLLAPRHGRVAPEAWIVPREQAHLAVRAISAVPEDELVHVQVADVVDGHGRGFLVVREGIGARRSVRAIPPSSPDVYVLVPGTRSTFVPAWAVLRPDLPASAWPRLLDVQPGEACFLMAAEGPHGPLTAVKALEADFVPASVAVEFLARGPAGAASDVHPPDPWAAGRFDADGPTPEAEEPEPQQPDESEPEQPVDEAPPEAPPIQEDVRPVAPKAARRFLEESLQAMDQAIAMAAAAPTLASGQALDDAWAALPQGLRDAVDQAAHRAMGSQPQPRPRRGRRPRQEGKR